MSQSPVLQDQSLSEEVSSSQDGSMQLPLRYIPQTYQNEELQNSPNKLTKSPNKSQTFSPTKKQHIQSPQSAIHSLHEVSNHEASPPPQPQRAKTSIASPQKLQNTQFSHYKAPPLPQIPFHELANLNKNRANQLKIQADKRMNEIRQLEAQDQKNQINALSEKKLQQLENREKQLEKLRQSALKRQEDQKKLKLVKTPEITLENLRKPNPKLQLANKYFPKPLNRIEICKGRDEIFYGKTVVQNKIQQSRKEYVGIRDRSKVSRIQGFADGF